MTDGLPFVNKFPFTCVCSYFSPCKTNERTNVNGKIIKICLGTRFCSSSLICYLPIASSSTITTRRNMLLSANAYNFCLYFSVPIPLYSSSAECLTYISARINKYNLLIEGSLYGKGNNENWQYCFGEVQLEAPEGGDFLRDLTGSSRSVCYFLFKGTYYIP